MPDSNASVIRAIQKNTDTTTALSGRVKDLAETLHQNDLLVRRTRLLTFWVIGLTSALGFGAAFYLWDTGTRNRENAYVQCLNANESRQFNRQMWDYILGRELGDTSDAQAPDEITMSEEILPRIHYANRPRDCENLDKKYDMPEVPDPPGGKVRIIDGKAVLVPSGGVK